MTKIKDIRFFKATSPLSQPIADSTHQIDQIAMIVARLELESGTTGDSYLLAFEYSPAAIAGALQDIRSMVRGWDVFRIGAFHQEFARLAEYFGQAGTGPKKSGR
jgi:L-alanine-DL-glutamate epimerase-like enolase superfamily enzyme